MKIVLTFCVIAGLSAGGYFLWKNAPVQENPNRLPGRPTTAVVDARSVRFAVNAAGDIGPADQVSVRPEVNGRISELPLDIGDKVVKDALLCRLDDRDLQIERSSRLAEMDGAKLQLQKALRSFQRNKQLFAEKLVSQEIFEDSRTEYDLATNAIDRAQQNLRMVEDRISKTKILAPFDCTVLTRPVSLGQTVSGAAGFNSGTEIMTIANLNDMIVNAHVNQADVTRLTPGQLVDVQVESVPGLTMPGVLDRIAPQAVIKNSIKGFSARILIKSIDPRVRPGMTSILSIPVSSAENVLAVPLAAVFTENGERYVFVKNDEKYERRSIVIGITDYAFAEVREGLAAGEVVSLEQTVSGTMEKPPGAGGGGGSEGKKMSRGGSSGITGGPGGSSGGGRSGGGGGPGGARSRSTGS